MMNNRFFTISLLVIGVLCLIFSCFTDIVNASHSEYNVDGKYLLNSFDEMELGNETNGNNTHNITIIISKPINYNLYILIGFTIAFAVVLIANRGRKERIGNENEDEYE